MRHLLAVAFVSFALVSPPARAAETEPIRDRDFGNVGVVGIGADTRLDAAFTSSKPQGGDAGSASQLGAGVNAAYFLVDGVSAGVSLGYERDSSKPAGATAADTESSVTVMPLLGFHFWLRPEMFSIWPQFGIGWSHTSLDASTGSMGVSKIQVSAFVPLLIHPMRHFHIGVGPFLSTDLTSFNVTGLQSGYVIASPTLNAPLTNNNTTIGLKCEIGGWL